MTTRTTSASTEIPYVQQNNNETPNITQYTTDNGITTQEVKKNMSTQKAICNFQANDKELI